MVNVPQIPQSEFRGMGRKENQFSQFTSARLSICFRLTIAQLLVFLLALGCYIFS